MHRLPLVVAGLALVSSACQDRPARLTAPTSPVPQSRPMESRDGERTDVDFAAAERRWKAMSPDERAAERALIDSWFPEQAGEVPVVFLTRHPLTQGVLA